MSIRSSAVHSVSGFEIGSSSGAIVLEMPGGVLGEVGRYFGPVVNVGVSAFNVASCGGRFQPAEPVPRLAGCDTVPLPISDEVDRCNVVGQIGVVYDARHVRKLARFVVSFVAAVFAQCFVFGRIVIVVRYELTTTINGQRVIFMIVSRSEILQLLEVQNIVRQYDRIFRVSFRGKIRIVFSPGLLLSF